MGEGRHSLYKELPWADYSGIGGEHIQAVAVSGQGRRPGGWSLCNYARGGGEEGAKRERSIVDG